MPSTTPNQRDVTLNVGIKTSGEQALRNLADEFQNLAKRGGEAAPAYTQLADELNRLGMQAASLDAFKTLSADVGELTAKQREAVAAAAEMGDKLAQQQAETQRFAKAQADASKELRDARDALQQNRTALDQLNVETARADRTGAAYTQQAQALKAAIVAAKDAVYQKRQALSDATDALSKAEAAESRLGAQVTRTARAAAEATELLRTAGERSAAALNEAFGKTGVRGLQAIKAEATQVGASLEYLEQQALAGAIGAQDLARAASSAQVRLAQLSAEARTVPALPGAFERVSSSINDLIGRFGALGAAVASVGVAVKPVIEATTQLEKMNRTLTSVTGSSEKAGQQIEFARNAAQRAGQSFAAAGDAYAKFAASALSSGVPLATVQKVFEATALAAGNLGLSSEEAGRILGALSQMASKGTVSMEELRQQLGDALPGALSLMAKGLGLSEAELNKLVESGGLLARDALPALAQALAQLGPKEGAGVSSLVAEFNRLKNVVLEASTIITGGAFGQAVGAALGTVSAAVQRVAFGVSLIGESFTVVGKQIGATVGAIVTGDFKLLESELARIARESNEKLAGLAERIEGTGTAAASASVGVQTLGGTFAQAAREIGGVTAAQQAAAESTTAAAQTASDAAASWVQLSVRLAENMDAATKAATVAGKLAEAKKVEADASAAIIAISGDEQLSRQAAARSAQTQADALARLAEADARVADVVRQGIEQLQEKARAEGRLDEATKKTLKTLNETLAAKAADAEKSRQQSDAARAHALALDVQAKSMLDNSGKVELYRAEVDRASASLASVIERMGRDKATKEDVQRATEALTTAEGLLRDAVNDRARKAEAAIEVMKLDHQIKRAGIQVQIEEARAAEVLARARGDEAAAAREALKQKELGIAISRDAVAQSIEEAKARKAAAEQELADTQNLTPEKQRELELRIKNADAAIAEAKAREAGVKVIEAERQALQQRNAAASGQAGGRGSQYGSTSGTGSTTAGNIDGSGMGAFGASVNNPSGLMAGQGGGPVDASYVFDLWSRFQQGRVSADELPAIRNALAVAKNNARLGGPGSVSAEGRRDDQMWIARLQQIIDAIDTASAPLGGGSSSDNTTGMGSASPTRTATQGASSAPGVARVVRIEMGGRSTDVEVASDSAANNLESVLRQLVAEKARAA